MLELTPEPYSTGGENQKKRQDNTASFSMFDQDSIQDYITF
jgi:hypothetical protein